jgi:hypothetical protein
VNGTLGLVALGALIAVWLFAVAAARTRRAVRRVNRRWRRRLVVFIVAYRWIRRRQRAHAPRPVVLAGDDVYRACTLSNWEGGPWACRWCNGLLPRDRTRFCSARCTDQALDNHVFDRARSARRRLDGYACVRCGSTEHLEVNHKTPILGRHAEVGCIHHLAGLETLCGGGGRSCHQAETNGQRRAGAFGTRRRWAS